MAQRDQDRAYPTQPSAVHDIITGGVEGSLGGLATEPLFAKLAGDKPLNPFRSGLSKRLAVGAGVGAVATGLIGAAVSLASKKAKAKRQTLQDFAAQIPDVIELRKRYVLVDEDEKGGAAVLKVPGDSKTLAAVKGGLVGTGVGAAGGLGAALVVPGLIKRAGLGPALKRFAGGTIGARYARTRTIGVAAHLGATAGAIQGVSNYNEAERRSNAIARALRKAKQEGQQQSLSYDALLTMFEATQSAKKSGVRLDKYEKTIQAKEIDRHLHNYAGAAGLGAVAGLAIPGKIRPLGRALIGAGAGVAGAGVLHAAGHVDEYGEQTEEAKILQRKAPKYIATAAILGGLVGRYRKMNQGIRTKLSQSLNKEPIMTRQAFEEKYPKHMFPDLYKP